MYNKTIKQLLSQIQASDAEILPQQYKYAISDNFSDIELYISDKKISYRVFGDAYILAMVKWLQLKLQNKEELGNISLEQLIEEFDLPEIKYRNALQMIKLIENINERSAI